MKATYNEKKQKFNLIYKDAVKELKGEKYPHTRIQRTWKGDKKPTQREIKIEIAKLEAEGRILEEASQIEADKIKNETYVVADVTNGECVNAIQWLLSVKASDLAKKAESKSSVKAVEVILKRFLDFIKDNYTLITLADIKQKHIEHFFTSIHSFCYDYQKKHFIYLKKLFRKMELTFRDGKHFSPFNDIELDDLAKHSTEQEKMAFTIQQIKLILEWIANNTKNKNTLGEQKFGIFYMLVVTGWRIGDILSLKWEQVDMKNRTITLTHSKTAKKTKHTTIIYITPLMMTILENQRKNTADFPFNTQYVFGLRKSAKNSTNIHKWEYTIQQQLYKALEAHDILKTKKYDSELVMNNYTLHCFRKSVVTELSLNSFSPNKITYLVGHADNSVEGQYYMKLKMYPERSTRPMIQHMEQITEIEYYYKTLKYGKKSALKDEVNENGLNGTLTTDLKNNFWNEAAVMKLEELIADGMNTLLAKTVIYICNTRRIEAAEDEVTADMVADVAQMVKWFQLDEKMKIHLS
jgi:integrase